VGARALLLRQLKMSRFRELLDRTHTSSQKEVLLDRMGMIECRDSGECDIHGERMLFAQASKLCEDIGATVRSMCETPLHVTFAGDEGIDAGGLYREFFDSCGSELLSKSLPLLTPTPNQEGNSGKNREAWQLSPVALTHATRRMFTFFGQLMGICLRRGDVLPMSLSRLTWKLLVGEKTGLEDLQREDAATASTVDNFMHLELHGVTPDVFEDCFSDVRFVFNNSAGEEVPLHERGGDKHVTFKNSQKFARAVLNMRLNEASEHVACIRAGMATVVPIGCLSLWTWRDLELEVCGNPFIDVAVLKRHVKLSEYPNGETCASLKYFWEALESFSQEELAGFLRFVWGRSRLPPEGSQQWDQGFIIHRADDLADDALPRAHTCFFTIDLPQYKSCQITKDKILFAVQNCRSITNE